MTTAAVQHGLDNGNVQCRIVAERAKFGRGRLYPCSRRNCSGKYTDFAGPFAPGAHGEGDRPGMFHPTIEESEVDFF